MKPLIISIEQWNEVLSRIKKDQPPSVWLSREKMRRVLGFTPREHQEWLGYYDSASSTNRKAGRHGYKTTVHLDFFNDYQRTMFLLKYGEQIGNQIKNS
jgi:hypothetical protein